MIAADFTLSRSRRFVVVGTGDFSTNQKGGILQMYDHEEEVHRVFGTATGAPLSANAECAAMKLFDNESWQLWTALAWVLTRDQEFTERAGPRDFDPHAFNDEYVNDRESDKGWGALFDALVAGSLSLVGMPMGRTGNPDQPPPRTGTKRRISPEIIRSLEWAWLPAEIPWLRRETKFRRPGQYVGYWNVSTSSRELLLCPPGSEPISHKVNPSEPAIRPEGQGYMGLSAAACWIACKRGVGSFFARDKEAWSAAFAKLLPAIADGNVEIIGRQNGLGHPDRINGRKFSSISVDYPYQDRVCSDLEFGNEARLECSGYYWEDEDGWEHYSDALWGAGDSRPEHTHLQVKKEDIRLLWPIAPRYTSVEVGAEDCYVLPAERPRPRQKIVAAAHAALLQRYPDRRVPKISAERLAEIASPISRSRGGPPLDRDSIRRALNLKR
jgi:hypothetical protein